MKVKRGLSGMYFRSKNEESGKWENVVFEDLSGDEQDQILNGADTNYLKGIAKSLADTIVRLGNEFDIMST